MKKIIYLLSFLVLATFIYADCSVTKTLNTALIYDFIEPDGRDADCSATILANGILLDKSNMSQNDLYYAVNFTDLLYDKIYHAFLECNKSGTYFYSECFFTIFSEIGSTVGDGILTVGNLAYPYYMGVNETETITLYDANMTDKEAYIRFQGTNYTMTNTSTYWYVDVTSTDEEDINFTIYVNHSTVGSILYNKTGVMRWHDAFYVTIRMLDERASNDSSPYKDDFHYIYLSPTDSRLASSFFDFDDDFYEMKWEWMDNLFLWIAGVEYDTSYDTSLAFWGNYNDGSAKIKLYEASNYSLNLITLDSKGSIGWDYEFIYPQFTRGQYDSEIIVLEISQEVDQSYEVYMSKWEINWSRFLLDIGWNLFLVLLWIFLITMVAILSKDGKVTAIMAGVTFPILLLLLGLT